MNLYRYRCIYVYTRAMFLLEGAAVGIYIYIYTHIHTYIYIYAYTYIYTHHSPLEQAHDARALTNYLAVLRVKILTNQMYSNFYVKLVGELAFEKFDWQCCAQDSRFSTKSAR